MIKCEELTNANSCMNKARDDEMTFVLLGRDPAAPAAIRMWISERIRIGKNQANDPQIVEAYECIEQMKSGRDRPAWKPNFISFADIPVKPIAKEWGEWSFDPKALIIVHAMGYEIDLEQVNSSAAILDWIFQIHGKTWCDAKCLHDLATAFRDILDPQAHYCSFEKDKRPNVSSILRHYKTRLNSNSS